MEYRSIVCPIDDSEISKKGADAAAYLSKLTGARLILLHVVEKWHKSSYMATDSKTWYSLHTEWLDDGREFLEKEEIKLKEDGVINIEIILRDGDLVNEILAVAKEKMTDLIVMASHHYTVVGKLLTGGIAKKITQKAPCPVLLVFE